MSRSIALVLLVTLLPTAAGGSVQADLRFDAPPAWRGDVDVRVEGALVDLSRALTMPGANLSWSSASGFRVSYPHERVGGNLPTGVAVRGQPENESLSWGPATLESLRCGGACEVFLLADATLSGDARGRHAVERDSLLWGVGGAGAPGLVGDEGDPVGFTTWTCRGWLRVDAGGDGALVRELRETRLGPGAALFVTNVTGVLRHGGSEEPFRVEREVRAREAAPGVAYAEEVRSSYALLSLEGAVLSLPEEARLSAYAPAARVAFDGQLASSSATGWLVHDGTRRELRAESLILEGEVDAGLLTEDAARDACAPSGAGPLPLRARLSGEASRVVVAGDAVAGRDLPPAVTPAAAAAGAASLALLALAGWALYTRIGRSKVLENPTRRAIHDAIMESPGVSVAALSARLGRARTVVQHHLAMLAAHRLVVSVDLGSSRGWYLASDPRRLDATATTTRALGSGTRRRVLEAVAAAQDGATQRDVAEEMQLSQRLVSYHLRKLEEAGLVQAEEGRPRRYRASPPRDASS